ncbi:MAG TPA: DUF4129 domain-containing protein [Planctomycetota bacterium]|nr:DUF4129 domain-containing protein [Planctomycetota bacterium]
MRLRSRKQTEKGAIEIVEEATHLLRSAPARTLTLYYLGALPFILGLLYYWADMSRSATARQHQAEAAMAVSFLFIWMKVCQSMFAQELKAQLGGYKPEPWTLARLIHAGAVQAAIQSTAFVVLPICLIATVPAGWAYAFYQNVTVAGGESTDARTVYEKAKDQAALWPMQNHLVLAMLLGFALFVYLNIAVAIILIPYLIKMLFGIESVFTQSWESLLNSTFFAIAAAATYLCVDPLVKAVYVLRCYYGDSLQSGADLKAGLERVSKAAPYGMQVLVLILAGCTFGATAAEGPEAGAAKTAELDQAITEVLDRREFSWRMPRDEAPPSKEEGLIGKFLKAVGNTVFGWIKTAVRWVKGLIESILPDADPMVPGSSSSSLLRSLTYVLIGASALALAILFWRHWKRRQRPKVVAPVPVASVVGDLKDENTLATQLPEDGWLSLASEMMQKGEYRLALRAYYLASLAHLAQRDLLVIVKSKSNREYERELRRRAKDKAELLSAFEENLAMFERVWYGRLTATQELLQHFTGNLKRMTVQR